jgi:hypothetical protein
LPSFDRVPTAPATGSKVEDTAPCSTHAGTSGSTFTAKQPDVATNRFVRDIADRASIRPNQSVRASTTPDLVGGILDAHRSTHIQFDSLDIPAGPENRTTGRGKLSNSIARKDLQ